MLGPEVLRKKVENGALSHADGRYLSRTDALSRRAPVRDLFSGREVSRAYLCTVCVYLSLSAKVLTSEAVTDAINVLRS